MKIGTAIILLFVLSAVNLYLNLRHETKEETQPINYELFEYKFNQAQERIDSLELQVKQSEQKTDSIKLQILTDEKKISDFDRHDLDSAFRTLFKPKR